MKEKNSQVIPFVIDTDYPSFHVFYEKEKHQIYERVIEAYEDMISKNETDKTLLIVAKAKGVTFDTKFEINKTNVTVLKEVFSPYFENLEEYEYCSRIYKIYSKLVV